MSCFGKGKIAIVTGGSRGFGLHLVRALVKEGGHVVMVARDPEQLAASKNILGEFAQQVDTISADVTVADDVERMTHAVKSKHGRLDLLVNCAGRSTRGLASETTADEFLQLMQLNFLAVVRCTQTALPMLLESQGAIINIGSLAGKNEGRYLGAYAASKFALSAYSHQIRWELSSLGVHVLLVCPGPIRRDQNEDHYHAEQTAGLPESAKRPGAGAPLKQIEPERLAEKVLDACRQGKAELVVPSHTRWLFALSQLSPRAADWMLDRLSN